MKGIVCICLFAMMASALARPDDHHYTTKYDGINVDEIIANKRLLDPYLKCILELGPCTTEGKELKSHIKDALETDCEKCSKIQKEQSEKVIKHLINFSEEDWKKLVAKYDPDNKFSKKYEHRLRDAKKA